MLFKKKFASTIGEKKQDAFVRRSLMVELQKFLRKLIEKVLRLPRLNMIDI